MVMEQGGVQKGVPATHALGGGFQPARPREVPVEGSVSEADALMVQVQVLLGAVTLLVEQCSALIARIDEEHAAAEVPPDGDLADDTTEADKGVDTREETGATT